MNTTLVAAVIAAAMTSPAAAGTVPMSDGFGAGLPVQAASFGEHRHSRKTDGAQSARSVYREPDAKPETAEQHRQYLKHYGF